MSPKHPNPPAPVRAQQPVQQVLATGRALADRIGTSAELDASVAS